MLVPSNSEFLEMAFDGFVLGTSGAKLETSSGALAAIVSTHGVVLLKGNPNTFGSNPNVKFVLSYKDLGEFSG